MKLRGWHIAGFGTLVDWRQDDLSSGLNVFYGPNEAGKSTLLGFLRFALFGFRPGNTKDPKYVPAPGLRHGGTIYLKEQIDEAASSERVYAVERTANAGRGGKKLHIQDPSGEEVSEAELVRLLGHADRDLFNNVFAFSLNELQSIESLNEKGVRDHIFSAGITGAGRSARDALEQIQKEADELFRGRAKTRSSALVDEIVEVDEALAAARERARGYPELAERERELAAKLEALRDDVEDRRRAGLRARKLVELWREVQGPLLENRAQLEGMSKAGTFGPDPRTRLETCTKNLERASERVANADAEIRKQSTRLDALAPDAEALAVREDVATLERDLGLYESQCKDVSSSEQSVAVQEQGLRDALAHLGPDWDEARLTETHMSVPLASEATRFDQRIEGARERVREVERELRSTSARIAELGEARDRAIAERDAVGSGGGDSGVEDSPPALMERRGELLRSLRSGVARRLALEARLEGAQAIERASQGHGANRLRQACLALAVLGVGTFAVLFANNGFRLSSEPLFVVAMVATVLGALGAFATRNADRSTPGDLSDSESQERELASLNQELDRAAAELGIPSPPSIDEIESAAMSLDRARLEGAGRDQLERRIRELVAESKRLEASRDRNEEQLARESEALESVRSDWSQWSADAGLPESLAPRDVGLFAGEIKTARAHLAARDEALSKQRTLFEAIDDWEARARRALDAANEEAPARSGEARREPGLIPAFSKLARRVREAEERERQRPEVETALAEARVSANAAAEAEVVAQKELADLFEQAGATDRDDYLAKLADHERRTELETRVRDQAGELSRRLGLGEEADALRAELETGRVSVWEEEAIAAESSATALQAESDELVRAHRDVENEIAELQGSDALGTLELTRATLQQELEETLSRWRELQVARGLIERTLARFERERQPAVLQEASHHFARVTGGRYPEIVQSAELGSFNVVGADGERKTPDQLSRGTAEQLYVCIRLGLIAEFCRRAGQLPVAMDDVLVNFDDERALAMANVLADFSQRNACQVLVFTCSSRTRDLFQQAAPGARHLTFDAPATATT